MCVRHCYLELGLTCHREAIVPDTCEVNHYLGSEFCRMRYYMSSCRLSSRTTALAISSSQLRTLAILFFMQPVRGWGAVGYYQQHYRNTVEIAVLTQPPAVYEPTRALKTLQTATATAESRYSLSQSQLLATAFSIRRSDPSRHRAWTGVDVVFLTLLRRIRGRRAPDVSAGSALQWISSVVFKFVASFPGMNG